MGWLADLFKTGATAFGFNSAFYKDVQNMDDEAATIGVFFVQSIDRDGIVHAIDLCFGARLHQLETKSQDYDDIFATMVGARFRF